MKGQHPKRYEIDPKIRNDTFFKDSFSRIDKLISADSKPQIHQSSKLAHRYERLKECKNDIINLNKQMTKLYEYALVNPTSFDAEIFQIIEFCLTKKTETIHDLELKKSTVAFIANIYQHPNTKFLSVSLSDCNYDMQSRIIEILYELFTENDVALHYAILQCATNIAADSIQNRNETYEYFDFDFLGQIINRYSSTPFKKIIKAAYRLVAAYCQFDWNEEKEEQVTKFISMALERIDSDDLYPQILKTMSVAANHPKCCQIFLTQNEFNIRFNSLLISNPENIINCLILFDKLAEGFSELFQNPSERDELTSLLDYDSVIKCLDHDDPAVICSAARVLSNAVLIDPSICQIIWETQFADKENLENNRLYTIYFRKGGDEQKEIIFLLTNMIRKSTDTIFDNLCKKKFIEIDGKTSISITTIFVDAISKIYDAALIDAILCSLTAMWERNSKATLEIVQSDFNEADGNEIIEDLKLHEQKSVAEQVEAFDYFVLKQNQIA